LPEISRVVLRILIADFVSPLLAVLLRLLPILSPLGPVLGEILATSTGTASIDYAWATSTRGDGRRANAGCRSCSEWTIAGGCGRELRRSATLQKIGRSATATRRTARGDCAGCRTGDVEEIIHLAGRWTTAGDVPTRSGWTLSSALPWHTAGASAAVRNFRAGSAACGPGTGYSAACRPSRCARSGRARSGRASGSRRGRESTSCTCSTTTASTSPSTTTAAAATGVDFELQDKNQNPKYQGKC